MASTPQNPSSISLPVLRRQVSAVLLENCTCGSVRGAGQSASLARLWSAGPHRWLVEAKPPQDSKTRALVRSEKRDPVQDEAVRAASRGDSGEPSAASRDRDERSDGNRRTALDPTQAPNKTIVSLNNADAVIDRARHAPTGKNEEKSLLGRESASVEMTTKRGETRARDRGGLPSL